MFWLMLSTSPALLAFKCSRILFNFLWSAWIEVFSLCSFWETFSCWSDILLSLKSNWSALLVRFSLYVFFKIFYLRCILLSFSWKSRFYALNNRRTCPGPKTGCLPARFSSTSNKDVDFFLCLSLSKETCKLSLNRCLSNIFAFCSSSWSLPSSIDVKPYGRFSCKGSDWRVWSSWESVAYYIDLKVALFTLFEFICRFIALPSVYGSTELL